MARPCLIRGLMPTDGRGRSDHYRRLTNAMASIPSEAEGIEAIRAFREGQPLMNT